MKNIKQLVLYCVSGFVFCLSGQAQTHKDSLIIELLDNFDEFIIEIEKDSVFAYELVDYNTLVKRCDECLIDYKRDSIYYHTEPNLYQFMAYLRKKYYY